MEASPSFFTVMATGQIESAEVCSSDSNTLSQQLREHPCIPSRNERS